MATKNTDLLVTGLDFDTIRANLRNYIASKPEFADYDFADSALGTLLDLLAYNTYYNAFYVNMATNEGFLDTAQQYDSVVSHAKALGYVPVSARGAAANVQLIFTNSLANSTFRSVRVPKNTQFTSVVNGVTYVFTTPQTYTISANTSSGFAGHINIVEGYTLTHNYVFNRTSNTSFVLPNENVDTNSITVSVTSGGNTYTYSRADDITAVEPTSKVFFVDADRGGMYKVSFGDGVIGNQPETASVVAIEYRVCSGSAPNGANAYSLVNTTVDGQSSISIVPVGRAGGGAEIEGIEAIRFNAPRLYETQNRSVTEQDYKNIIYRDNPDVAALSVWGGEENDPPIYGKVFVAAKPIVGTTLSLNRKNEIKNAIRKYNVQSIDVEIVDPTYLYIVPLINVRYDSKQTTMTPGELAAAVSSRVVSFESEYLGYFNDSFKYSRFLDYIDSTDNSIQTTDADIRLRKTFRPSTTSAGSYTINFNNPIQRLGVATLISGVSRHPGYGSLTSSPFVFDNRTSYLDDNGFGVVRTYYPSTVGRLGRVYTNYSTGTVDYDAGTVYINNFSPTGYVGSDMSILVAPTNPNIKPVRNQILLMAQCIVNIIDDKTGKTVASASNVETIGQTATILTPSIRLTNF